MAGREIPISLVYKKSFFKVEKEGEEMPIPSRPMPLLLYGYVLYGICGLNDRINKREGKGEVNQRGGRGKKKKETSKIR